MTAGELKIRLLEDYGSDASIEDIINAITLIIKTNKKQYIKNSPNGKSPHPLIVHCLDTAIQHLHNTSITYYASLK